MRFPGFLVAILVAFSVSGCGSVAFMATPGRLEAQRLAACHTITNYAERDRCLSSCRERQQQIWANDWRADRDLRTPSSLADDPGLAMAVFGG